MVLLGIKKQHVSAYHWPSSDFFLKAMTMGEICCFLISNNTIY